MTNCFRCGLGCVGAMGLIVLLAGCGAKDESAPSGKKASGGKSTASSRSTGSSGAKAASKAASKDGAAPAEGWGTLRGRFVFDGKPEEAAKVNLTQDREFCGKHDLRDESLVVDPETGGLANVIVYLYLKRGEDPPASHPSYADQSAAEIPLDNENCRFQPHVQVVTTSQTLLIGNRDTVGHNTKIDTASNAALNQNLPAGGSIGQKFTEVERQPAPVSCSIHPWMRGYILVCDNPYSAVTGKNGEFEIANVPAGEWTFQVWHESGTLTEVSVDGAPTKWSRGRVEVSIAGDTVTNLGEIKVSPDTFK